MNYKSMYKNELAEAAGVSRQTFYKLTVEEGFSFMDAYEAVGYHLPKSLQIEYDYSYVSDFVQ